MEHWLEREIAQWVYHEGSIQRTMSERSYHGATLDAVILIQPITSRLHSFTKRSVVFFRVFS